MTATAARHGVAIVGGETTASPGGMLLSIAMLGTVEKGKCPLRSGARAGDVLFVTGELGGSMAGRHLDFEPRLAEARWLAANTNLRAMLDLSDGLAGDLRRMTESSHVGAELHGPLIPVSRAARQRFAAAPSTATPPLAAALTDGEDFELLFAVPAADTVAVKDGFRAAFPDVPLTCVGKITAEPGLRLRDARGVHELHAQGYDHFARPV
jgi:thiamine-monophosphate kinase